jgi:hypothetical protein
MNAVCSSYFPDSTIGSSKQWTAASLAIEAFDLANYPYMYPTFRLNDDHRLGLWDEPDILQLRQPESCCGGFSRFLIAGPALIYAITFLESEESWSG